MTEHSHYRDDTITRQEHAEVIRVIATERNQAQAEVARLTALLDGGETGAVERVARWLARFDGELQIDARWPVYERAARDLIATQTAEGGR